MKKVKTLPRDPKDISLTAPQQQTRRIAENEDAARGGSRVFGQATAGAEGPEGPPGPAGSSSPIARGTVVSSIAAGTTASAVITVTHGLGAKPTFVAVTPELGEGTLSWGCRIIERTATQFKFQLNTSANVGALTNFTALWFAA